MDLEETLSSDELHKIGFEKCPAYIHEDHRWALCILFYAQEQGWLPKPCDLVMFDQHHDGLVPRHLDILANFRAKGISRDVLVDVCGKHLSEKDDDWVLAGIELGLIKDVVMFGVHDRNMRDAPPERYKDQTGVEHRIKVLASPINQLNFQGCLSEELPGETNSWIWEILRWQYSRTTDKFSFEETKEPIWVDFDLDFFAYKWMDYTLPWSDQIFTTELLTHSQYVTTNNWTGKSFLAGLINNAGLMTIATEPGWCGGTINMMHILNRFNHYLFDNELKIPKL